MIFQIITQIQLSMKYTYPFDNVTSCFENLNSNYLIKHA